MSDVFRFVNAKSKIRLTYLKVIRQEGRYGWFAQKVKYNRQSTTDVFRGEKCNKQDRTDVCRNKNATSETRLGCLKVSRQQERYDWYI